MRTMQWFVMAAILMTAIPASAQVDEKKVNVNVGAGYTFALSDVRTYLGDGWNLGLGLTFNLNPKVGLQVEYGYTDLGNKDFIIPVAGTPGGATTNQTFTAHGPMHNLDFNLVFKPAGGKGAKASPYIVAGGGYYHRSIEVTTPAVGYVPPLCNPWYYVCYPGGFVPVDKVVGHRSSDDFGIDVGGGVDVKINDSAMLFFELRYHYIPGKEVTDASGVSHGKANGHFLPFTVGIRF
jgi:opacity protein-like surface antigen